MSALAALLRRAGPDPAPDSLASLRDRVETLAARSRAVAEKGAALDAREAGLRQSLDSAIREGLDADDVAASLAGVPGERLALTAQANAISKAFTEARAALDAEEKRLRELEIDAEVARLEAAERDAEAAFYGALVAAGVAFENLLDVEARLKGTLFSAGRSCARASLDAGLASFQAAELAAKARARQAAEEGRAGERSHLAGRDQRYSLPFAVLQPRPK